MVLNMDSTQKIIECGDVMYDACEFYKPFYIPLNVVERLKLQAGKFAFCTLHRQENTDHYDRLKSIISALNTFSDGMKIVLPMHPRTRKILEGYKDIKLSNNIEVIEPLGYLETQSLISKCAVVLTDSGGLQKEAYFHQRKCVTVRDETEWTELVEIGVNAVVGAKTDRILEALNKDVNFEGVNQHIYGDGKAAEKIVRSLLD